MESRSALRILIIGRGGRESALAFKLSQSPRVEWIFVVPGNGGTVKEIENVSNIAGISEEDFPRLIKLAKNLRIHLVVPSEKQIPHSGLRIVDGIEKHFRYAKIPCFAPSKEAAQIEGSKAFSKGFMARHGIPTAEYRNFTHFESACQYVNSISHKVVLKISSHAAGKGVTIPETKEETLKSLKTIMVDHQFGFASDVVVIEEFLDGDELSILTFSDGVKFKSMPPAQVHKRAFDGDTGPNTGGMGCYAPTKITPPSVLKTSTNSFSDQPLKGCDRKARIPFVGMLFTGIMLTKSGPKVLEYNARFGDPETQTLLPLLKSDLADLMVACVEKRLHEVQLIMDNSKSCAVIIMSSQGYPGKYSRGNSITMKPLGETYLDEKIHFFHAGTKLLLNGDLVTSGGRVMGVSATADSLEQAVKRAYHGVQMVEFDGMFYRRDIAHRALN